MKKAVIAAATAAFLAGTALAHAAGPDGAAPPQGTPQGAQQTAPQTAPAAPQAAAPVAPSKDKAAFDTRLATVKAGLKLTADQEKLWPAFETTLRSIAQERAARIAERRAAREAAKQSGERPPRPDPVARLRTSADRMTNTATELRQLADSLGPLYQSFDATQKGVFDEAVRTHMRGFFGLGHPPRGDRPRRG